MLNTKLPWYWTSIRKESYQDSHTVSAYLYSAVLKSNRISQWDRNTRISVIVSSANDPQSYKWKDPPHKAMRMRAVAWSVWWREDKDFCEMYAFDKVSFIFLRSCVLLLRHLSIMAVELYKFTVAPTEMVYISRISCFLSLQINFMWQLFLPLISTVSRLYPNCYLQSSIH